MDWINNGQKQIKQFKMEKTENHEEKTNSHNISGIIDIRGINFDITSVLKDVTKSIKTNLKESFDDVFKDYELYKSTHDALLQIPFIKDLYNKNLELSLQVKMLKQEEEHEQQEEEEEEEHEPTITLNIHESSLTSGNPVSPPLTDFLKTNKINKKQTDDSESEIISEEEEEEESQEEAEEETEE